MAGCVLAVSGYDALRAYALADLALPDAPPLSPAAPATPAAAATPAQPLRMLQVRVRGPGSARERGPGFALSACGACVLVVRGWHSTGLGLTRMALGRACRVDGTGLGLDSDSDGLGRTRAGPSPRPDGTPRHSSEREPSRILE